MLKAISLLNNVTSLKKSFFILSDQDESMTLFYEKWVELVIKLVPNEKQKEMIHFNINTQGSLDGKRLNIIYSIEKDGIELKKFS